MAQYICKTCALDPSCNDCKDKKGNRQNVENCGDHEPAPKRLDTRQYIKISGYYIDSKQPFDNYICVVNSSAIGKDDEQIFYYFDSWQDVDSFREDAPRGIADFVITEIRAH